MSPTRTLPEWLSYIERVHPRAWDLGLERVRAVSERLGVLPPAPRNIVVAGTNGKGSTSVYAEALLRAAGFSVGTTISPHLTVFNERIRLNGAPVADGLIARAFASIEQARGDVTLTYFEYGILAALWVFRDAGVQATVLEVGLGGRLDAVNIVNADIAVITSIGLDHQDYLGSDLESIGREKAGVLRAGVPVVFGEARAPQSVLSIAASLAAPLLLRDRDFGFSSDRGANRPPSWIFWGQSNSGSVRFEGLKLPSVALANAASALQAVLLMGLEVEPDELVEQASHVRLAGRFDRRWCHGRDWVLDVAHNPHGATFLAGQLAAARISGRTVAVMGCLKDKDAAGIVAALRGVVDEWIFVDTGGDRGQTGYATRASVDEELRASATDEFEKGMERAVQATKTADRILVLGSFDVVSRATQNLSVASEGATA